jgi:hypothetical protein
MQISRGTVIVLVLTIAITAMAIWGVPAIKRALIGQSYQVRVVPITVNTEEFEDAEGDIIPRTVAKLEIFFPMGSAPERLEELKVLDEEGRTVDVYFSPPDREDLPDTGVTRWEIKEAIFPHNFRKGQLHNAVRQLTVFWFPEPPYVKP